MSSSPPAESIPCFPDVLHRHINNANHIDEEGSDVSEVFFELANAPIVGYKLPSQSSPSGQSRASASEGIGGDESPNNNEEEQIITVRQNSSVQEHTGGIVWETSYLLASYLLERYRGDDRQKRKTAQNSTTMDRLADSPSPPLGKVLEIGSGCGMLGLVLAASGLSSSVILTECSEVMDDLRSNVQRNIDAEGNSLSRDVVSAQLLRWDCLEEDIAGFNGIPNDAKNDLKESLHLRPHSFDTIVGTDVVFTPTLVRPLLACLALMAHKHTNIYLCLQVRCADSHALLLKKASKFGLRVKDCSHKAFVEECPSACSWGIDMECKLLHITVKKTKKDSALLKKGKSGSNTNTKSDEKKAKRQKQMDTSQVTETEKSRKKRRKLF